MTIRIKTIESVEKIGGRIIADTTVWDYHNSGLGGKGSNLRKTVNDIFAKNPDITTILAICGKKGRSQHSATNVHVFDVTDVDTDKIWLYDKSARLFQRQ